VRIALYQPDIAQNVGTVLRLAACWDIAVDIIEPCGFPFNDRKMRRAGMDYLDDVDLVRHSSWQAFLDYHEGRRLVLLTTKAAGNYCEFAYEEADILLLGRESAGVPDAVHDRADARLVSPMKEGMRSINMAMSAGVVLAEGLRQLGVLSAFNR